MVQGVDQRKLDLQVQVLHAFRFQLFHKDPAGLVCTVAQEAGKRKEGFRFLIHGLRICQLFQKIRSGGSRKPQVIPGQIVIVIRILQRI